MRTPGLSFYKIDSTAKVIRVAGSGGTLAGNPLSESPSQRVRAMRNCQGRAEELPLAIDPDVENLETGKTMWRSTSHAFTGFVHSCNLAPKRSVAIRRPQGFHNR